MKIELKETAKKVNAVSIRVKVSQYYQSAEATFGIEFDKKDELDIGVLGEHVKNLRKIARTTAQKELKKLLENST